MKLSVIIPTYNEEKYLPHLLKYLQGQTFRDFEVIISDAGSTDNTKRIASGYGIKVVEGGIPSVGRNKGAFVAHGEILCFLDADVVIGNDFLKRAVDDFERESLDVANVLYDHEHFLIWISRLVTLFRSKKRIYSSQCLLIKRKLFENLRGFDERFIVGEDVEFGDRVNRAGLKSGLILAKMKVSNRRLEKIGVIKLALRGLILYCYWKVFPKQYLKVQNWAIDFYGGWNY